MKKKYNGTLPADERNASHGVITAGKAAAWAQAHARRRLKADAAPGGPGWTDPRIAGAVDVDVPTVERVRQRFVEHGLEAALGRKPQGTPSRERKPDGKGEARLVAPAGSKPPQGRAAGPLRRRADTLVELQVVDTSSHETVRQVLKKANVSRGGRSRGASRRRRTRRS